MGVLLELVLIKPFLSLWGCGPSTLNVTNDDFWGGVKRLRIGWKIFLQQGGAQKN